MNSFTSIFRQHFKPPPLMLLPCIDLSPSPHQILKSSPPCSHHLWETLYPVLYPDIFSHCWISISNKYVKQVLINNSWISPTLQKGWKLEFCLFFKKWGRVHFSLKKGEVGKIVEEWRLLRYIYKSKKFYYIPKFLRLGFK